MSGLSFERVSSARVPQREVSNAEINAAIIKRTEASSGIELNKEAYTTLRGQNIPHDKIVQALRENNSEYDFESIKGGLHNLKVESEVHDILSDIISCVELTASPQSLSHAREAVSSEMSLHAPDPIAQHLENMSSIDREAPSLITHTGLIGSKTDPDIIEKHPSLSHNFTPWTAHDEYITRSFSSDFASKLKSIDPSGDKTRFVLNHIQKNFQDLDAEGQSIEASDPAIQEIHTRIKNGIGDLVEEIGLQKLKERFPEPDFRVLSGVSTTVGNHELDYMVLKREGSGYSFANVIGSAKTQFTEPSFKTDMDRLTEIIKSDAPIKFRDPSGEVQIEASAFRRMFHQSDSKDIKAKIKQIVDIGVTPGSDDPVPRDSVKQRVIFGETTDRLKGRFLTYILENSRK